MQFLVSPGNLSVLAKVREDYRGFRFSGSCKPTSEASSLPPYGVANHKIP